MRFLTFDIVLLQTFLLTLVVPVVHVIIIWDHADHFVVVISIHEGLVYDFDLKNPHNLTIISAMLELELQTGELLFLLILEVI